MNISCLSGYKGYNSLFIDVCDQAPLRLPTKNLSRSFEAHCQDEVGSVSLTRLRTKAANI